MANFNRRSAFVAVVLAFFLPAMSGLARATTLTVTTLADSGPGTLRQAILSHSSGDSIDFSVTGTITLLSTLPMIADTLTIMGPASPGITISGGGTVQLMVVSTTGTLNLQLLTLANGSMTGTNGEGEGGAVINDGTLTVANCTFSNNQAIGGKDGGDGSAGSGGAISSDGPLTITDSTFSGNKAIGGPATMSGGNGGDADGGAIFNTENPVTITNSTFSGNQANGTAGDAGPSGTGEGGAIWNKGPGVLTITNTTFSGNQATRGTPGGGTIYDGGGTTKLKGTILATGAPQNCGGSPAVTDVGFNISDDSSCGFGSTSKNSNTTLHLVTPPSNNGGPTQTIVLGNGSSAIGFDTDCTDQQTTPQPVLFDQRQFTRPDSPSKCDSGAYEHDGVGPIVLETGQKIQIARSSSSDADEVNMAFTFTDNGVEGVCNAGNDALNGIAVGLFQGTCADLPTLGLELNLDPFVVHTIGDESYGTFFGELSPTGTVSARIVQLGLVDDAPCGQWTLNVGVAGISAATYGLTGGSGPGTTYALTIQDEDGAEGCFDIDNAVVGSQVDPTRDVRRDVRR